MKFGRWYLAALCLSLAAQAATGGEGITTETLPEEVLSADFDGDGTHDLWVVDPSGVGRLLLSEDGILRERTREMDLGAELSRQIESATPSTAARAVPTPITICGKSIKDQGNPGGCLRAGSSPTLGRLYPLTQNLFVDATGNVGINTLSPSDRLSVLGTIESTDGGFRFPDGSVQTTATAPGVTGDPGPQGPQGPPGSTGPSGQDGITALNSQFGPALNIAGGGTASTSVNGSTVTVTSSTARCTYANKTYSPAAICYTAGNQIPCAFGFRAIRLSCNPDGSWQEITSTQCFEPEAGPRCGA